jgi:hypothetical protein
LEDCAKKKQTSETSKELLENFNYALRIAKIYPRKIEDIVVKCPDCGCKNARSMKLEQERNKKETGLAWKLLGNCGHKWKIVIFDMGNSTLRAEVTSKSKSFIVAGNYLSEKSSEACKVAGGGA